MSKQQLNLSEIEVRSEHELNALNNDNKQNKQPKKVVEKIALTQISQPAYKKQKYFSVEHRLQQNKCRRQKMQEEAVLKKQQMIEKIKMREFKSYLAKQEKLLDETRREKDLTEFINSMRNPFKRYPQKPVKQIDDEFRFHIDDIKKIYLKHKNHDQSNLHTDSQFYAQQKSILAERKNIQKLPQLDRSSSQPDFQPNLTQISMMKKMKKSHFEEQTNMVLKYIKPTDLGLYNQHKNGQIFLKNVLNCLKAEFPQGINLNSEKTLDSIETMLNSQHLRTMKNK